MRGRLHCFGPVSDWPGALDSYLGANWVTLSPGLFHQTAAATSCGSQNDRFHIVLCRRRGSGKRLRQVVR